MADLGRNFSLRGAVDLESLKHKVHVDDAQAPHVIPAGKYVVDTTQETFETMVQTSATFPIVVVLWIRTDERLISLVNKLSQAVNDMDGQLQLSRIEIAENPLIAQSLRIQGAPAVFALIAGRPMPILQGLPREDELHQLLTEVLPKLVEVAQRNGITGKAPYIEPLQEDQEELKSDAGLRNGGADRLEDPAMQIPQEHQLAYQFAQDGDFAKAAQEYGRIIEANPSDLLAKRERAKVLLLERSGLANVREVRQRAGDFPQDIQAQMAVADIDMIGGQVADAFDRLLDAIAQAQMENREQLRERLLEYFDMLEASDPRLKSARKRLASLLY